MSGARSLTALLALSGTGAVLATGYLAALSVAAALPGRRRRSTTPSERRLVVLVPAHNEASGIARCLRTLREQQYPSHLYSVVVVADNCDDDTADIARAAGVEAWERVDTSAPGKGRALRWAMDRLLATDRAFDVVVVVDADTIAEPGLLGALAVAMSAGAAAAQADYEAWVAADDARSLLRSSAFLLSHRARFMGKARLNLPCNLVGNGMALSRELTRDHPWSAFSEVEDLEYTVHLRLAGVRPVFVPAAGLMAPVATGGPAAEVQRMRWEGGRFRVARTYVPQLVGGVARQRRTDLLDLLADLVVPPVGVLGSVVASGLALSSTAVTARAATTAALLPWAAACGLLTTHVLVGLYAADAPGKAYRALLQAPVLVLSETRVRYKALARARRPVVWERTPRHQSAA